MSKAMNRSFTNVLFGGFGNAPAVAARTATGLVAKPITAEDAATQLAYASKVIVIPGYGMAVAQSQHQVRELADLVEKRGGEVRAGGSLVIPASGPFAALPDGPYTVGFRPNHLYLRRPSPDAFPARAEVAVTEITGSESFVHVDHDGRRWIALAHGVHELGVGEPVEVWLEPRRFFVFDKAGDLAAAPALARAA